MGTVGKGITMAPIGCTVRFGKAQPASCGIRDDPGLHRARAARNYAKIGNRLQIAQRNAIDAVHASKRRRTVSQTMHELVECGRRAPSLDHHTLSIVPDLAGNTAVLRQPPDGGTEPDTLHQTAHPDGPTLGALRRSHVADADVTDQIGHVVRHSGGDQYPHHDAEYAPSAHSLVSRTVSVGLDCAAGLRLGLVHNGFSSASS